MLPIKSTNRRLDLYYLPLTGEQHPCVAMFYKVYFEKSALLNISLEELSLPMVFFSKVVQLLVERPGSHITKYKFANLFSVTDLCFAHLFVGDKDGSAEDYPLHYLAAGWSG